MEKQETWSYNCNAETEVNKLAQLIKVRTTQTKKLKNILNKSKWYYLHFYYIVDMCK